MKLTKNKLRQIIREEAQKEINEARYNGPGDFIFDEFYEVLDQAEGRALGNDFDAYEQLLTAMKREIEQRLEAARSHMT